MPFQPTNVGYDTNAMQRPTPGGSNGFLGTTKGAEIPLWVYEVQTGFGMAGSTMQSQKTRSFAPHNMEQQTFAVLCQFPNQQRYADAVEFIRSQQRILTSSMRLMIYNRADYRGRKLKGIHRDIYVEGYVLSVPREHRQYVYAPDLRFDFMVERIHEPGPWAGAAVNIDMMQTWRDVVEKDGNFVPPTTLNSNEGEVNGGLAVGPNGELRPR